MVVLVSRIGFSHFPRDHRATVWVYLLTNQVQEKIQRPNRLPTPTGIFWMTALDQEFYATDLNVNIIFSPFTLSAMFSPKDVVPDSLKSRVVYQLTCASCGARYIGETNRHFKALVKRLMIVDDSR